MIILHEDNKAHIQAISKEITKVYGINNIIKSVDLNKYFESTTNWKGNLHSSEKLQTLIETYEGIKCLIITPRDLYINNNSQEDDWIFGYCENDFSVVATARMKRKDNHPSDKLHVSEKKYLERVISMIIHEIAHDLVKGKHLVPAVWVSQKNNYQLPLGPHCTNNKCVLCEVVDIRAPPKAEGYMLLGTEKRYDAGIDDFISRRYDDWFCKKCKDSIVIGERYFQ
jgi:predicted Zn-dependent protease